MFCRIETTTNASFLVCAGGGGPCVGAAGDCAIAQLKLNRAAATTLRIIQHLSSKWYAFGDTWLWLGNRTI